MPLKKFNLDLTGILPANKVIDEIHTTIDVYSGIVIPEFKNYFTESLIVKNGTNVILERNTDWIPIEFNQDASLKTGKEVCTALILLTNLNSGPIKLTYQVYGGPDSYSSKNLIETYLAKVPTESPIPYADLTDKPLEFPSKHHLHDADEMYGLEYIVKKLDRILYALQVGSFPTFKELLGFIDTSLLKIQIDMSNYLDENMAAKLQEFKDSFTVKFLDLDNLSNLKSASELEGIRLGAINFNTSSITENKYIVIETLIGFKKTLYENLIRKDYTGLDLTLGTYTSPYEYSVRDLRNRATFNLISKEQANRNSVDLSDQVYPLNILDSSEVSITKLSNALDSNDGDLILVDQTNLSLFWGIATEELSGVNIAWKKITEEKRLAIILEALQAHENDKNNPHELTKNQINLGLVENLPIVTKEEIDALKSVRSYITFDTLLYFARKHLLQNGPPSPVPADSRNKFIIDNAVVVYSPGGKPATDIVDPKVTGLDGTFPVNMTIGWSINGGASGKKFKVKMGLLGTTPVETEYTLSANGNFVGYLPTGATPGTIQSIFTFSGGQIIVTNTLVQESNCEAPEPPAPEPPPPPPPAPPPPAPTMGVNPASVSISGETGESFNYLAGQISNGIPTGVVVPVSGSLPPGLSLVVSTTVAFGTYPVSIVGVAQAPGSFTSVFKIIGAEDKFAQLTVNAQISAAKVADLTIATNRTTIYPESSETITVTASGGKPNSNMTAVVSFTYLDGRYKVLTANVNISLNNSGSGTGTCAGGNPGAKIVAYKPPTTWTATTHVSNRPTLSGGLPLGKWQIQASTVGTSPIKKSNSVIRSLVGIGDVFVSARA